MVLKPWKSPMGRTCHVGKEGRDKQVLVSPPSKEARQHSHISQKYEEKRKE